MKMSKCDKDKKEIKEYHKIVYGVISFLIYYTLFLGFAAPKNFAKRKSRHVKTYNLSMMALFFKAQAKFFCIPLCTLVNQNAIKAHPLSGEMERANLRCFPHLS